MGVKESVSLPAFCVSLIVHLIFWITTAYILYICYIAGYSLMTLHVAFFTVGCGLLMTEATLMVSGEALFAAKVSKGSRIRIHWILNVLGLALVIAGFVVIEIHKFNQGANNFTSDHGKIGLAGTVVALAIGLAAVPTIQPSLRPKILSLRNVKLFHVLFGILTIVLLITGQITGVYRFWWRGTDLGQDLTTAAYVVGTTLLLIKPLVLWGNKIYGISE